METKFEWDIEKDLENQEKHKVSFVIARKAFEDPKRIIIEDEKHSTVYEKRYFCIGQIEEKIVAVRFTYRGENIRIIGAGIWRNYRKFYLQSR